VVVGLSAVTVSRGGRAVLGGVELELRAGEVAVVEGANGSGKTSLLRVLAGLAAPAAGSVRRDAGPCAFVPERVALAPRLAALDWLRAMDGVRGARRSWPEGAAGWELGEAALARPAAALSKGRLQRVVLCEALTAPVGLLVLDEPWAGLDEGGRDLLARRLRARADEGAAVVLADHSGARRGRLRAEAVWQVGGGGVQRSREAAPEVLVVATRERARAEHLVARGEHDALLARLLGDGWSIESVGER
jgi:ABC-type transport system involved in cytochrome c biogenesis ATPase subunit